MKTQNKTDSGSACKRVRVLFSGNVQGVGFRYATIHIARQYEVSGYVKNLDDGCVEVVAEGDERTLREFVAAIESGPLRHYIRSAAAEFGVPRGEFKNFDIRY